MMKYKEFQPDKELTDYVKSYWWFDSSGELKHDYAILPDGCFDLIISFNNNVLDNISLTGIWTRPIDISIEPNKQLFGIRFKLLAVDYIIQQRISSFCDGEQIKENDFWQIDRLPFSNLEKVTELFDTLMLSMLEEQKNIDTKKQKLFCLLYQTYGEKTVEQYSKEISWTSRQINRYFKDRFGLPLKSYCKILKCFASYKDIKKGQLYPQKKYFDQAHFIKEIKAVTGNTPTNLFENKNDRFLQLTTMKEK